MGSNMTQGAIQAVAAERLGVPVTSLLAVQVAGACAGKMVCISSILVSSSGLGFRVGFTTNSSSGGGGSCFVQWVYRWATCAHAGAALSCTTGR